ncbi:competence protein CoiA family protein [Sutcliffiella horikoshii]|uniref:competence protein CoiA family protein n=1 Tax=Sutcliffiella horikoshii TaxID=79883 RepID=UPI003CE71D91
MNTALLNGNEVNIEKAEEELARKGLRKKDIKSQLVHTYRRFSQKGSFMCICCNTRVDLVLGEERAYHFRHFNKDNCTYSENHINTSSNLLPLFPFNPINLFTQMLHFPRKLR